MRLTNDPQFCLRNSQAKPLKDKHGSTCPRHSTLCGDLPHRVSAPSSGRFCRLAAQHLCRGEALLDPCRERRRCAIAPRIDEHEAACRAAADPQRSHMRLRQRALETIRADPHHQCRAGDAAAHRAPCHEAECAHHLLLGDAAAMAERAAHALGRLLIERQPASPPHHLVDEVLRLGLLHAGPRHLAVEIGLEMRRFRHERGALRHRVHVEDDRR